MIKKVSMIIPIYNAENYIRTTLDCALAQVYSCLQIIAVNDASTDNTLPILYEYKMKLENSKIEFIIINHDVNKGLCAAINSGLKVCTGEFLCFPDADDEFSENYLSEMINILESTGGNWTRCSYTKVLESENREYNDIVPSRSVYKNDYYDFVSKLVPHNAWNMVVRSNYFFSCIGRQIYDTHLTQEWSILLPLSFYSNYERCEKVLYRYYIRKGAMSNWINGSLESVVEHFQELSELNKNIISKLEYNSVLSKQAIDIYYNYSKLNITIKKTGIDGPKEYYERFIEECVKYIDVEFINAINNPNLIIRFVLDNILEMDVEEPYLMYDKIKKHIENGFVVYGDTYEDVVSLAFGNAMAINSYDKCYDKLPKLLLIENSRTISEIISKYPNSSKTLFYDFRDVRNAIRGWAHKKRYKV